MTTGIDVSDHNGEIDFHKVAVEGHSFAIAKATEGKHFTSKTFPRNWREIREAGLRRGAYHYARWEWNNALKEAEYFVRCVEKEGGLLDDDFNPFLDMEWNTAYKNAAGVPNPIHAAEIKARKNVEIVDWAEAWIERVRELVDRHSIVYTGPSFVRYRMMPKSGRLSLADHDVWIADYDAASPNFKPWETWSFWQISGKAKVSGVPTKCDLNRFNGTVEELDLYTGLK